MRKNGRLILVFGSNSSYNFAIMGSVRFEFDSIPVSIWKVTRSGVIGILWREYNLPLVFTSFDLIPICRTYNRHFFFFSDWDRTLQYVPLVSPLVTRVFHSQINTARVRVQGEEGPLAWTQTLKSHYGLHTCRLVVCHNILGSTTRASAQSKIVAMYTPLTHGGRSREDGGTWQVPPEFRAGGLSPRFCHVAKF